MKNIKNQIDSIIDKVLKEEIDKKSHQMSDKVENEWVEIETKESLRGGQHKLDVAKPKGKITSADFKKLRSMKKTDEAETDEGNAFTGALSNAKEKGKDSFEVDGKKYKVTEEKNGFRRLT